jgi:hypothetical protein
MKGKKKYALGGDVLGALGNIPGLVNAFSGKSTSNKAQSVGSTIGSLSNFIVPGLGSVLSPLLGGIGGMIGQKDDEAVALQEHYNQVNTTTNPYQLQNGGAIGSEDNFKYQGNTHAQGGIDVDKNGLPVATSDVEVEGGENMVDLNINGKRVKYVFSNTLKI